MNVNVKPCPFCGNVDVKEDETHYYCPDCGGKAVKIVWEMRTIEDLLKKRIEELVKARDEAIRENK